MVKMERFKKKDNRKNPGVENDYVRKGSKTTGSFLINITHLGDTVGQGKLISVTISFNKDISDSLWPHEL